MSTPPKGAIQCHLQINTVFLTVEIVRNRGSHVLTTVNALNEEDRPQHWDHFAALFYKCVGSFKSPDRVSGDWAYG